MKKIRMSVVFGFILLLVACEGLFSTPVETILNNPREYDGRLVKVSGTVTQSMNLFVVKYFVLRDESGEITVVTPRILPRQGNSITIRGHVREAFTVGDEQLLVIVEETEDKK